MAQNGAQLGLTVRTRFILAETMKNCFHKSDASHNDQKTENPVRSKVSTDQQNLFVLSKNNFPQPSIKVRKKHGPS